VTPRATITAYAAAHGADRVVDGCLALLAGADYRDDVELLLMLGGESAASLLGGSYGPYWPRVWALRGLRWCWDGRAAAAVVTALADDHWRVREMAAKVAGAHGVDDAVPVLAALHADPNARVVAAARAAEAALVG
jgi:HEAT repeat protein